MTRQEKIWAEAAGRIRVGLDACRDFYRHPDGKVSPVPASFVVAKTKEVQDRYAEVFGLNFHIINITQLFLEQSYPNTKEQDWNIRTRLPLFAAAHQAAGKPILWYWDLSPTDLLGFAEMRERREVIRYSIDCFVEAFGGEHGLLYASREELPILNINKKNNINGVYNWAPSDFNNNGWVCEYTEDELYREEKLRSILGENRPSAAPKKI